MKIKEALETIEAHMTNCAEDSTRAIAVLDRGWIFVGDLSFDEATKMYTMTSVKNVRTWKKGGFGLLSKSANDAGATLDNAANMKFHGSALIFAVPVGEGWDA
jgi:hypothetical protein